MQARVNVGEKAVLPPDVPKAFEGVEKTNGPSS
jgi:hypothetical protein